jgi:hypothetical protein
MITVGPDQGSDSIVPSVVVVDVGAVLGNASGAPPSTAESAQPTRNTDAAKVVAKHAVRLPQRTITRG